MSWGMRRIPKSDRELKVFLGAVAFCVEKNGAEFQDSVVGDAVLPVFGERLLFRIAEVPLGNGEKIRYLLACCLVWLEPTVFMPLL